MTVRNEYLDHYLRALEHQAQHDERRHQGRPDFYCFSCHDAGLGWRPHPGCDTEGVRRGLQTHYSWAVPNDAALDAIAEHSPNGVVEIGAGGGYWAKLLRARGVDVIAYDPDPDGGTPNANGQGGWHDGTRWSEVLLGDHTSVTGHPDRTLFLCWPSYDWAWTDQVLDLYEGSTVVYVGEGHGGCTGTERMHRLLGGESYCWHDAEDKAEGLCDCDTTTAARFKEVRGVEIPQWYGLHDSLHIYERVAA